MSRARAPRNCMRCAIDYFTLQPRTYARMNLYDVRKYWKSWIVFKACFDWVTIYLILQFQSMVMKTQLEMFNSAVIAYFSGNGDKLSEVRN